MVNMVSIYTGGILTLLLAVLHSQYYRLFDWKNNFESVSPLNARIFYTIHMALLVIFIGIGLLSLIYTVQLSQSRGLAFGFNVFISLFWLWRFVWQLVYFRRGKDKKTPLLAHILTIWFFLLFLTYLIPTISHPG